MSHVNVKPLLWRRDLLVSVLALPLAARSQGAWPSRPIRLVVPSAAGGAPDIICRLLASELAPLLGQPVVIENKPGAGGGIGMSEVSRATPDGHTLGYGNVVTLAINRSLYSRLPYDPDALIRLVIVHGPLAAVISGIGVALIWPYAITRKVHDEISMKLRGH